MILAASTCRLGIRKAILSFQLSHGVRPKRYFCDNYSAHHGLLDNIGYEVIPHPSHGQSRNVSERSVKEIKTHLRKCFRTHRGEPVTLGSLTFHDLSLLLLEIQNSLNLTPISSSSRLCPADLLYPNGGLKDLAQLLEMNIIDILNQDGGYRESTKLLQEYAEIIRGERNKNLLDIQKKFEHNLVHKKKKGERTDVIIKENDVVLCDYEDGKRLRMGRVEKISPHGGDALIKIGAKQKICLVKNLRLLSIFRTEKEQS